MNVYSYTSPAENIHKPVVLHYNFAGGGDGEGGCLWARNGVVDEPNIEVVSVNKWSGPLKIRP